MCKKLAYIQGALTQLNEVIIIFSRCTLIYKNDVWRDKMLSIDDIRVNMENLCLNKGLYVDDYIASDDEFNTYIEGIDNAIERISLSDLDSHYENGIGKNESFMPNAVWPYIIGYALLSRYGLSEDEYLKWAEKFDDKLVAYELMGMIGVERPDLKKMARKQENEKKKKFEESGEVDADIKANYERCIKLIRTKKPLIIVDKIGNADFLGNKIFISDNVKKVSKIILCLAEVKEFAINVFEREFSNKCTSYKSCSNNIELVLRDSYEALWIKFRKKLISSYDEIQVNGVGEEYIEFAGYLATDIKEQLDQIYLNLCDQFEDVISTIDLENERKINNINIHGGGFGIKGAAVGALGAKFAAELAASYVNNKSIVTGKKVKSVFENQANEIYTGEGVKELYIETILNSLDYLLTITFERLDNLDINYLKDESDIIDYLDYLSRKISDEMLQSLCIDLICRFPFDKRCYQFLHDNYTNYEKLIKSIKEELCLPDAITVVENNWTFSDETGEIVSYRVANSRHLLSKKKDIIAYESGASKGELFYRILFRIRAKALIESSSLYDSAINKYIWDISDDDIMNLMPETKNKAYILLAFKDFILYDTGFAITDKNGKIRNIELEKIKELLVVGAAYPGDSRWIAICKADGTWSVVPIAENKQQRMQIICDIINISLDIKFHTDTSRKYRDAQCLENGRQYLCKKCGYIGPAGDSGAWINGLICRKCCAKSSYLYCVEIDSNLQSLDETLCSSIDTNYQEGLFVDEEELYTIVKQNESVLDFAKGKIFLDIDPTDYRAEKQKVMQRLAQIDDDEYQEKFWNNIDFSDVEQLPKQWESVLWMISAAKHSGMHTVGWTYALDPEILNLDEIKQWVINNGIGIEYIIYFSDEYIVTDKAFYLCNEGKVSKRFLYDKYNVVSLYEYELRGWNNVYAYLIYNENYMEHCIIKRATSSNDTSSLANAIYMARYGNEKSGKVKAFGNKIYCEHCKKIYTLGVKESKCPNCKMKAKQYGWKEYCGVKTIDNIPDSIAEQILIDTKVLYEFINRYYLNSDQELETIEKDEDKKLMFCPYCGKQILRTVKFCNFCGKQNKYSK